MSYFVLVFRVSYLNTPSCSFCGGFSQLAGLMMSGRWLSFATSAARIRAQWAVVLPQQQPQDLLPLPPPCARCCCAAAAQRARSVAATMQVARAKNCSLQSDRTALR